MNTKTLRRLRARVPSITIALLLSLPAGGAFSPINSQTVTSVDRDRGHVMLKTLKNETVPTTSRTSSEKKRMKTG